MTKRTLGWFVLATALIGAAAMLLARDYLQHFSFEPHGGEVSHPWRGLLGIAAAMVLGGIAMYPIAVIVVVGAAIYGPIVGVATFPGAVAGALLGWYMGRRMGQDALKRFSGDLVKRLLAAVERHAMLSAMFVRWIPGLPFALQNAGLGAARVPFLPFLAGTSVGLCVNQISMIAGGVTAIEAVKRIQNTVVLGWIGVGIAAAVGFYLVLSAKPATATKEIL